MRRFDIVAGADLQEISENGGAAPDRVVQFPVDDGRRFKTRDANGRVLFNIKRLGRARFGQSGLLLFGRRRLRRGRKTFALDVRRHRRRRRGSLREVIERGEKENKAKSDDGFHKAFISAPIFRTRNEVWRRTSDKRSPPGSSLFTKN